MLAVLKYHYGRSARRKTDWKPIRENAEIYSLKLVYVDLDVDVVRAG